MVTTGIYTIGISLLVSIDLFFACLVWGARRDTLPQRRPWLISCIFGAIGFLGAWVGATVASMEVNPQALEAAKFIAAVYFMLFGFCSSEESESRKTGVGPNSILLAFGIAFLSSLDCLLAGTCLASDGAPILLMTLSIGLAGTVLSFLGLKVSTRIRAAMDDESGRYESYANYVMASICLWS